GIWSAISPSWFTYSCFAKSEKEKAIGQKTLLISGGAGLVTSLGILLVFGKLVPAIAGGVTTVGLYLLGQHALSQAEDAPATPTMPPPPAAPLPAPEMKGLRRPEMHYGVIRGMGQIQPDVL